MFLCVPMFPNCTQTFSEIPQCFPNVSQYFPMVSKRFPKVQTQKQKCSHAFPNMSQKCSKQMSRIPRQMPKHQVLNDSQRSEEHTSALQSRVDISSAVFCLTKKNIPPQLPCLLSYHSHQARSTTASTHVLITTRYPLLTLSHLSEPT